jgi:hypothetical protein
LATGSKQGVDLNTGNIAPEFLDLAAEWCRDQSENLLGFVWQAYEQLKVDQPFIDGRDLERSITQVLEPRIRSKMSGDEPFYFQHKPGEHATMLAPPAQPPEYDMAFVLRAEERIMWPMEAKVLETDGTVADYVKDIREQFLTCRYAPFSGDGAMIGYLLSGSTNKAFNNIAKKTPCVLEDVPAFIERPHKLSRHTRSGSLCKIQHSEFRCHHLILEFLGLKRASTKTELT